MVTKVRNLTTSNIEVGGIIVRKKEATVPDSALLEVQQLAAQGLLTYTQDLDNPAEGLRLGQVNGLRDHAVLSTRLIRKGQEASQGDAMIWWPLRENVATPSDPTVISDFTGQISGTISGGTRRSGPWPGIMWDGATGRATSVTISGGTLTDVQISQDNFTTSYSVGASQRQVILQRGEAIRVTYSVAPTMAYFPVVEAGE